LESSTATAARARAHGGEAVHDSVTRAHDEVVVLEVDDEAAEMDEDEEHGRWRDEDDNDEVGTRRGVEVEQADEEASVEVERAGDEARALVGVRRGLRINDDDDEVGTASADPRFGAALVSSRARRTTARRDRSRESRGSVPLGRMGRGRMVEDGAGGVTSGGDGVGEKARRLYRRHL
jgi:hypothetical protein